MSVQQKPKSDSAIRAHCINSFFMPSTRPLPPPATYPPPPFPLTIRLQAERQLKRQQTRFPAIRDKISFRFNLRPALPNRLRSIRRYSGLKSLTQNQNLDQRRATAASRVTS